jgi:septum formation protein
LIILASQSPRREQLLKAAGFEFQVVGPNVDETMNPLLSIDERVQDVAMRKALNVKSQYPHATIIAADTVVVCQDEIFGKPVDERQARQMLHQLSGQTHEVKTAVVIVNDQTISFIDTSIVMFRSLTDHEIEQYIQSNEWLDKAGAYGIQGLAAEFVSNLDGSFENVMGLPIEKIKGLL